MAIRQFFARLTGAAPAVNPQEAEYRRLSQLGDDARRRRAYAEAEQYYRDGMSLARAHQDMAAVEVFLGLLAALFTEQGRYDEAAQFVDEALMTAQASPDAYRKARALLNKGALLLVRGDLDEAKNSLEPALALGRQAHDLTTINLALCNLADTYMKQDNPGYALRLLRDALPAVLNNPTQASNVLGRMGKAQIALGDTERGQNALTQALNFAEQNSLPEQEVQWLAALIEQAQGEYQYHDMLKYYTRLDELREQGYGQGLPAEFWRRSLTARATAQLASGQNDHALALGQEALKAATEAGDTDQELSALLTIGTAHQQLGQFAEGTAALERAIAIYAAKPAENVHADHIKALLALGNGYQKQKQYDKALQQYQAALELAGDDDALGRANTLRNIGDILTQQGNPQAALEQWQEALGLYEHANATAQAARLVCDIGAARRSLSGINAAMPDYERATILLNSVKDAGTRGYVLSNVANVYTDLGEIETAQSFYQESIHLARQVANRRAESLRLGNFGWFRVMTGKPDEGLKLLEEALTISRSLNDRLLVAVQTSNLGLAHHEMKELALAEFAFRDAIVTAEKLSETRWSATFRSNLGRTLLAQGKVEEAVAALQNAMDVLRTVGDQEALARTQIRLADAYLRQGKLAEAEITCQEGETLARKWGYRKGHADALMVRAGIFKARGDEAHATQTLREARKLYTILNDPLAVELTRVLGEDDET
ncbi:MAG: tetratricopeptide repeat protein [Anaerolineae bacterium]|nr:tetratricopeptide repeat protein [Anaerolineae bacterium]